MAGGWDRLESPFHAGELWVQDRLGLRGRVEGSGRRFIRDYLPEQHRRFHAALPFVLIGAVDAGGRPWASLLSGLPGFVNSPDPGTLDIASLPPPGDPLHGVLEVGADIGLLGIELETRRRNRVTGRVASLRADGFTVAVRQTFGNCPQYIQTRDVELVSQGRDRPAAPAVIIGDCFDKRTSEIIADADTLFVATAFSENPDAPSHGADVSHRGGKPGFVRVEDERTFVFPDFSGNNHFNTIGNIVLNPKAGFLFVDFQRGDLVYMTGGAEIVWDGEEVRAFPGAERLIRFRVEEVIRVEGALPLRFRFGEYSPMLRHTGSWARAAETIAAERERNVYVPFEVFDVRRESDTVASFYLRRVDGRAPARHEPGQFLPIRVAIPGQDTPAKRTYTISAVANGAYYRLSIKREGGAGLVSNFLHDHAKPGFRIEAMAPRGRFLLESASERPVVLLSAGVGITPMVAMANHIIEEGLRTRRFRRTCFIHGARNGRQLAFAGHLRDLAARHDALSLHIRLSDPDESDRAEPVHDSEGRVDVELVKSLLPPDDCDFYLCGPQSFMQSLYDGLSGLGVPAERIHYESFGPATVLKQRVGRETNAVPVRVTFAVSGVEADWTPRQGTLLDLAEAAGLTPAFACRSGICGTCATRIRSGSVDYVEEPSAPCGDDEALICCAVPRPARDGESCGDTRSVVLDL
jgi:ferredoxin-NADP reductase/predicted pyridoxine 5'-phosphate oxidase superfamily flavin-nucleotide-binding protein